MKPEEALRMAQNSVNGCFLCNSKELQVIGCYVPDNPEQFGTAPGGKMRTFFYGICGDCFELSDIENRVEEKLMAGLN